MTPLSNVKSKEPAAPLGPGAFSGRLPSVGLRLTSSTGASLTGEILIVTEAVLDEKDALDPCTTVVRLPAVAPLL